MLLYPVKLALSFEQSLQIPIHTRPHLSYFLPLPHSRIWKICNPHISIHFPTLPKNTGVYPKASQFGTRRESAPLRPLRALLLFWIGLLTSTHGAAPPARRRDLKRRNYPS